MTEQTEKRVRGTRKMLTAIDNGMTTAVIIALSAMVGIAGGALVADIVEIDWVVVIGVGCGMVFASGLFVLVWIYRVWILSRATFEIAADGIATNMEAPTRRAEPAPLIAVDGAIVKGQGTVIGLVIVKPEITVDEQRADRHRDWLRDTFPEFASASMPLILAYREPTGAFTYQGRPDLVDFLVEVDVDDIPWQRYVCR